MKKTLFLIVLLGFFSQVNSQDYRIGIGKAWIRFDSDSNMLKIGAIGTPPMLGREFNSQLFKFNTSQFSWSTTTGLNLSNFALGDSISAQIFSLQKDTIIGEGSYNKSWSLQRDWYRQNDSLTLLWHYRNSQFGSSADYYAINKLNQNCEITTPVRLNTNYDVLFSAYIPHLGQWRFEMFFDYEFEFGSVDAAAVDSIYLQLRVMTFPVPTIAGHWVKTYVNQLNGGEKGTGYLSVILPEVNMTTSTEIQVRGLCSLNAINLSRARTRLIDYLRCNLELIH